MMSPMDFDAALLRAMKLPDRVVEFTLRAKVGEPVTLSYTYYPDDIDTALLTKVMNLAVQTEAKQ